ncbi:transmembrane protein, putative [Medicago truncatula]|uniref:Transmembrane protein, putative n=1 Tax=Medicago truncatula TaxID=3880 RepID=A0A072UJG2_MEDTR|nr:transmembrane protein, putative [Medicago truncatula]
MRRSTLPGPQSIRHDNVAGVGTVFTFHILILFSHILTRYPIHIKQGSISNFIPVPDGFRTGLDMGSGWVPICPLPVPYPCFEVGENRNPYLNPVKASKTREIGFGLKIMLVYLF